MAELIEQVAEFVAEQVGVDRRRLTLESRFFLDLGVAGDDGLELLTAFAERFGVDIGEVDVSQYFGPELPATPLTIVRWMFDARFRRGGDLPPIRLSDLIESAKSGRLTIAKDHGDDH